MPIPEILRKNERLRATYLSGAIPLENYLGQITDTGSGTVEVSAQRPYRVLDRVRYGIDEDILLETVDIAAYNDPVPNDGPCVFTGQVVFYTGSEQASDDGRGQVVLPDVPLAVCGKTARCFRKLGTGRIPRGGPHVSLWRWRMLLAHHHPFTPSGARRR